MARLAERESDPDLRGAMYALQLLGQVDLRGPEGQSLLSVLSQTKRFALLAYLAAESGDTHQRDTLLSLFWPEHDDDRARRALNQAVYQLRRSLGDGVLVSIGEDQIGIDSTLVHCDVTSFERSLKGGEPAAAAEAYGGDLLAGFHLSDAPAFEEWLTRRREQLRDHAAYAALSAASSARTAGEIVEAARWARRSTELAPFDEPLHRSALEILEACGDRAGALRTFEALAERMESELSTRPAPETRRLVERIGAEDAGADQAEATPDRRPREGGMATSAAAPAADSPSRLPEPLESRAGSAPAPEASPPSRLRRGLGLSVGIAGILATGWALYGPTASAEDMVPGGALDVGRVLVMPFDDHTGDPELEGLGRMAADWITQELARSGLARVVPMISLAHLAGPETWADPQAMQASFVPLQVARDHDAGILVSGSVYRVDDEVVFQATVTDASSGDVLRAVDPVSGPTEGIAEAVGRLRDGVVGAVVTLLDPTLRAWSDFASSPPDLETYRLYAEGIARFVESARTDAWPPLMAAAEADTAFTAPLIWAYFAAEGDLGRQAEVLTRVRRLRPAMAPWDGAMADYVLAWDEGDYLRAYEAARRAANVAPDSEWEYKVAAGACRAQLREVCAEALERLYPFDRGWMASWASWRAGWGQYLRLLEELGRHEAQLEGSELYLERAANDDAIGGGHLSKMAALIDLGRTREALGYVDSVAEDHADAPWMGVFLANVGRSLYGHGYEAEALDRLQASARWYEAHDHALSPLSRVYRLAALYWLHRMETDPDASRRWLLEAVGLARALDAEFPEEPVVARSVGMALARSGHVLGDSADAQRARALEERLAESTLPRWHGPVGRARIAAAREEMPKALTLLEEGYRDGLEWGQVANWIDYEPLWDHPRFRMMWPHQQAARRTP